MYSHVRLRGATRPSPERMNRQARKRALGEFASGLSSETKTTSNDSPCGLRGITGNTPRTETLHLTFKWHFASSEVLDVECSSEQFSLRGRWQQSLPESRFLGAISASEWTLLGVVTGTTSGTRPTRNRMYQKKKRRATVVHKPVISGHYPPVQLFNQPHSQAFKVPRKHRQGAAFVFSLSLIFYGKPPED